MCGTPWDKSEAIPLRLVVRQFTPTHSNVRNEWGTRLVPFETLYDWKCFDAKTGKDLAREIAGYFIPDFANWKDHDSYQNGFDRLLKDLKSPDAGAKSAAAKD
jgi:hypothetical protein